MIRTKYGMSVRAVVSIDLEAGTCELLQFPATRTESFTYQLADLKADGGLEEIKRSAAKYQKPDLAAK